MNRSEKLWCLALSAVLILVTTLPFLLAYEQPDAESRFTGFLLAVEDGNSYIAKMRRGAEGDWLFRSPYTAEPQAGVPAFLLYLLLGKLAAGAGSHEQLVALLHLTRILAVPLAVYATYRFASRFLREERWRKWATLLAVAGGGLGWVILAGGRAAWLGSPPLELYSPEAFGFLASLTFPHLLLERAFLLLALDAYLEADARPRAAWAAAGWLIGVFLLQPLSIAAAGAAIGAHQIALILREAVGRRPILVWRRVRPAIIALTAPVILVGAYAALARGDAFLRTWAAQNILTSPHLAHYLLAYGLVLPLAILGGWRSWKAAGEREGLLLAGWAMVLPALAYLPVAFQRRLPEGGWVALCVLAAIGLAGLPLREIGRWRIGLGVLAASMITSVLVLIGVMRISGEGPSPAFVSREQVDGYRWLAENAPPDVVVLSSYATGNALPAWAPVFVVIGHGPETAGLSALSPRVSAYFAASGSGSDASALLQEFGVSYVFVGDAERSLGFSAAAASTGLAEVFRQGSVAIYEVADE
jgi:hypothetical protein